MSERNRPSMGQCLGGLWGETVVPAYLIVFAPPDRYYFRGMIKALLLIFEPPATWERIVQAQRSLRFILFTYLLPLLVLVSMIEAYGLMRWGKVRGDLRHVKTFSLGEAVIFELAQLLLTLLVVFVGAKLIKSLGETFHGRHSFTQSFTVVAYGLGPLFLMRLLDAFPGMSPWVSWGVGIILCVAVLYQGVPRVMQPDPPHAFGLYIMSALLLVIVTGLARFVTAWYLKGKFPGVENALADLISRTPL